MEKWADLWLRPLPGTDIAWINGLIRLLIGKGVPSKTEGMETLRSSVEKFSAEFVKNTSGISPADLEESPISIFQLKRGPSSLDLV